MLCRAVAYSVGSLREGEGRGVAGSKRGGRCSPASLAFKMLVTTHVSYSLRQNYRITYELQDLVAVQRNYMWRTEVGKLCCL